MVSLPLSSRRPIRITGLDRLGLLTGWKNRALALVAAGKYMGAELIQQEHLQTPAHLTCVNLTKPLYAVI